MTAPGAPEAGVALHPVRLFLFRLVAGDEGATRCAHCNQLWPCPVAISMHSCMDSGVCDPGHRCAFLAEWEGNLNGSTAHPRRRADVEAGQPVPVDDVRPGHRSDPAPGRPAAPARRLTPAHVDTAGRLVIDDRVRGVLVDALDTLWPGQYGTVDDYLARRLPCGSIPAAVSVAVKIAYGAVEAADQLAATR